jgi:2-methylfumaryl-CoA isomerase
MLNATDAAARPPILAGLRVVELTAFIAAPLCGLTLAQLGAEVVRVDPLGGNIDRGRWPLAPSGRSIYWASLNRGKASVEIDIRKPEGKRLVASLVAGSGPDGGIFVTNLPLDGELAYEALSKVREDLIMVTLTGSPDGRIELDYTVNSTVGFPLMTGSAGQAPVNHVLPAWDAIAGLTLANAVLAAERHRRATGRGQLVQLTLSDVAMATASNLGFIAEAEINGTVRRPDGNFLYGAYGDAFVTADARHVMIVAISNRQWRALAGALGLADALDAAAKALGFNLDDEGGRYEARELISACLRPWFAKRTLAEVDAVLGKAPVLWGVYRTVPQMLAEDVRCSEANPVFRRVTHPGVGTALTAATPLVFGDASRAPPAAGPRLGEHTASVLASWAGLDAAEIARLSATGVIGGANA